MPIIMIMIPNAIIINGIRMGESTINKGDRIIRIGNSKMNSNRIRKRNTKAKPNPKCAILNILID